MSRTPWVTVEGVNGVGKTHLARMAAARVGERCVPLVELGDVAPEGLPGSVVAALRANGDMFLRTGHPHTETLLLTALAVHRWESLRPIGPGQVVLEDGGPHSVAVYQAAVIAMRDGTSNQQAATTAWHILSTIAAWRPAPAATVLLLDDPARCLARFEQRVGRATAEDERALMARVGRIYRLLASAQPDQYVVIDRQHVDEHRAASAIASLCLHIATAATPLGGGMPRPTGP